MNDRTDVNLGPFLPRDRRSGSSPEQNGSPHHVDSNSRMIVSRVSANHHTDDTVASAAELLAVIEAAARRWPWCVGTGLLFAMAGFYIGMHRWETRYSARAQLVLYDASHVLDVFRPKPYLAATLPKLIQAPEVLRRVSTNVHPRISVDELASYLKVVPERNGEFVTVAISARTPENAVELINLYTEEAVRFSKELQAQEATEVKQFIEAQVKQTETDLKTLTNQFQTLLEKYPAGSGSGSLGSLSFRAKLAQNLDAAREELVKLMSKFKETYPAVIEQQAKVRFYEEQLAQLPNPGTENSPGTLTIPLSGDTKTSTNAQSPMLSENRPDVEVLRGQIQSLESTKFTLSSRAHAAAFFTTNAVGYYRLYAPARVENVTAHGREMKVLLLAFCGSVVGVGAVAALVLFLEVVDERLKTREDVQRVTGLPVLTAAGDLNKCDESVRAHLAFRAWLAMRKRFTESSNGGIICGLISSNADAECSNWLHLLAQAANQCGHRALTIAAGWTEDKPESPGENSEKPAETNRFGSALVSRSADLLACTTDISERLEGPNAQAVVHLLVPEWGWNVQAHEQWQAALDLWSQINGLVILVELPPACLHNAVLLAQRLPNLLWFAASGKDKATETQQHLEILRQAGCPLVGAVLSHEPPSFFRNLLPRWRRPTR